MGESAENSNAKKTDKKAKDVLKGRGQNLERWKGERVRNHRALLLWAMQTPEERSMRSVGKAMGTSEGSIRNWFRQYHWQLRAEGHGSMSDIIAMDMYRMEYMADYGTIELPHVVHRVVQTIGASSIDDEAAVAAHDARVRAQKAIPKAQKAIAQATAQALASHKIDKRQSAQRHILLLDASLGLIAKKLKAKDIRVTVRDIPLLLECRERLVDVISGTVVDRTSQVVDTARVKYAKETGGDVVAAMLEDAQELVTILSAIQSSKDADLTAIAEDEQRLRLVPKGA